VTAGLVASSAVDFVSGFEAAPLCEKPIQPDVGGGGVTVAPVAREEVGSLLGGVPFVGSSGGVIGLGIQPDVGGGGVTVAPVAREEVGLLLGGVPFVGSSGGVIGLGIIDGGAALAAVWSTDDSNLIKGGVGEGALALPSHCPNGVFGDAGRGLSEAGFSPLTSSSSPPDTGAFARGELRSGRVLGLPRPLLVEFEDGDGDSEGDSEGDERVAVGC